MDSKEFFKYLIKVKNKFGDDHFPDERVHIFWENLKSVDDEVACRAIELLLNKESSPLLPDLLNALTICNYKKGYETDLRKDAEEFFNPKSKHDEDEGFVFKTIREKLQGLISQPKYDVFLDVLREIERNAERRIMRTKTVKSLYEKALIEKGVI